MFDTEWTQDRIEENKLVNQIRARVKLWREGGYIGVTPTTNWLLAYWTDPDREKKLSFCQIEALETDMRMAMEYEKAQGRQVYDVHEEDLGYDLKSLDPSSGELRLIEVKGLAAATGAILWSPNEKRAAEDRRDCYWLYVVTNCATNPTLQEPVRDPARFPWQEVKKVSHYQLSVAALTGCISSGENSQEMRS